MGPNGTHIAGPWLSVQSRLSEELDFPTESQGDSESRAPSWRCPRRVRGHMRSRFDKGWWGDCIGVKYWGVPEVHNHSDLAFQWWRLNAQWLLDRQRCQHPPMKHRNAYRRLRSIGPQQKSDPFPTWLVTSHLSALRLKGIFSGLISIGAWIIHAAIGKPGEKDY